MFNNSQSVRTENNISLSSVSGTLVKTHDKSKFARMTLDSRLSDNFFNLVKPSRPVGVYEQKPIEVLQVMLCGDGVVLVEFIDLE